MAISDAYMLPECSLAPDSDDEADCTLARESDSDCAAMSLDRHVPQACSLAGESESDAEEARLEHSAPCDCSLAADSDEVDDDVASELLSVLRSDAERVSNITHRVCVNVEDRC